MPKNDNEYVNVIKIITEIFKKKYHSFYNTLKDHCMQCTVFEHCLVKGDQEKCTLVAENKASLDIK